MYLKIINFNVKYTDYSARESLSLVCGMHKLSYH